MKFVLRDMTPEEIAAEGDWSPIACACSGPSHPNLTMDCRCEMRRKRQTVVFLNDAGIETDPPSAETLEGQFKHLTRIQLHKLMRVTHIDVTRDLDDIRYGNSEFVSKLYELVKAGGMSVEQFHEGIDLLAFLKRYEQACIEAVRVDCGVPCISTGVCC